MKKIILNDGTKITLRIYLIFLLKNRRVICYNYNNQQIFICLIEKCQIRIATVTPAHKNAVVETGTVQIQTPVILTLAPVITIINNHQYLHNPIRLHLD